MASHDRAECRYGGQEAQQPQKTPSRGDESPPAAGCTGTQSRMVATDWGLGYAGKHVACRGPHAVIDCVSGLRCSRMSGVCWKIPRGGQPHHWDSARFSFTDPFYSCGRCVRMRPVARRRAARPGSSCSQSPNGAGPPGPPEGPLPAFLSCSCHCSTLHISGAMTAYEAERDRRIAANQKRLAELGLRPLRPATKKRSIRQSTGAARGTCTDRRTGLCPARRSLRVQGAPAQEGGPVVRQKGPAVLPSPKQGAQSRWACSTGAALLC